ncbi:MAG: ComEA family DNA-binding protein [Salibacteraceae bacterium]
MNWKTLLGIGCLWCCLAPTAWGQTTREEEKNQIIEYRIELIAENLEAEELDFTTLFDELSSYYDRPLDLNSATAEDLGALHLLNEFQINALFEHRRIAGDLISIYELQGIKGFDLYTIRLVLPFVKVGGDLERVQLSWKEVSSNGSHELLLRYIRVLEEQEGYTRLPENNGYLGDPNRYYARYRFTYGRNLSVGFTAEKDAGEEFFIGSQSRGFDFYSGHAYLGDYGRLKHAVVGDYQLQFGQGLTFWSGLAFGKSSDLRSIKRNAVSVKPYTSVDENLFLRGAATTVEVMKNLEATVFYSSKNIDANRINGTDTLDGEVPLIVSSFQLSGFHRTENEIEDRKSLGERLYGGNLRYRTRSWQIGATGVRQELDGEVSRNLSIANQFDFNNNENLNLGIDGNWVWRNFNFFGEVSRSQNGAMAYLSGAMISLDPRFSLYVLHRNFARDFHSITNNAIGENSRNVNERGLFIGAEARPFRKITLTAYLDRFRFNWLRFRSDAPDYGHEILLQANYKPTRSIEAYVRYRQEVKGRNEASGDNDIRELLRANRQYTRFQISVNASEGFRFRSRLEFSNFNLGSDVAEQGYLAYQDVSYRPKGKPIQLTLRYSLFDTDGYDSRIYAYENDVLYFFSVPAFYDRGSRAYLLMRYRIRRGLHVWLRYSQTFYDNRTPIGSGLEAIDGDLRSEIKAQLRYKF